MKENAGEASAEALFARNLKKVRQIAREQGNCISEEQVRAEFEGFGFNESQFRMVFDYLARHQVGINEPLDPDSLLTEQERDYLQDYLDEINRLPVCADGLREAETISAMAGDRAARRRLTEIYLKDVVDIARLYTGQGVLLEDLVGEGNVALAMGVEMLGSLEKPSEAPGMLAKLVMDAMEELIRESAENARTDKKAADKVNQVADKAKELAGQLRRKVTPQELAEETGLSMKAILDALRMSGYKIEEVDYAKDGL